MSYTIIKTNGTVLTTIADGTLNTTSTSIDLPGRLYPGYGQVVDTNFVHLLENFSDASPPVNPLQGQLWYNTSDNVLCICPSDGETNALAWYTVLTSGGTLDITSGNVVATGNVDANNFNATNNVVANLANVNYLTVNTEANIANANVTGNIIAANLTGNHFGNGAALSAITGANVIGQVANATAANTLLSNTSTSTTAFPTFVTSSSNGWSQHYINSGISANLGNASITATTFVGALSGAATSATTAGTVTTAAQPNITSTGTLTSATVTGNVTSGNVYANSGTIGASLLTGTLTTATQPNITSTGTLTSLGVSGVVTASRFTSNVAVGTAPLTVTSTTKVTNLNADLLDGYDADATATASSIVLRDTAGNVAANYFIGNGALLTGLSVGSLSQIINGSSNVSIPASGGNVNISVGGVANTIVANGTGLQVTGNVVAGNLSATGITGSLITASQPNITAIGTLTSLSVNGNITAANITANTGVFTGNGAGLTNIPSSAIVGTIPTGNYSTYAGIVTIGAQPNITSTGILTSVNSSGNITAPNVIANTGAFYGSGAGLTNLPGANVTGTVANATYAASAGSVSTATTAGTVTTAAQPNISSVGTLTSLNVLNKVTAGQLQGDGGNIGNIRAGNVVGTVSSATTAGYATTAGSVSSIPSGTKMIFAQTSAPTGWTKQTSNDNAALRVVSGSAGSGGSVNFTSAFTAQAVVGTVSGTVGGTALTIDQIPSHTHGAPQGERYGAGSGIYSSGDDYTNSAVSYPPTTANGGGQSHTHSFSGDFSGSSINLAVKYVDVIVATKD